MSKEDPSSGGAPASSGGTTDDKDPITQPNTVSYDSFKKAVDEKKRILSENETLKKRLDEIESSKLQEEGKFKESFEKASKRASELEKELKVTKATYAYNTVRSQVVAEAAKAGCVDAEALVNLYHTDLSELDPDEQFNVKPESVKSLIERAQKEKAYLFQKQAPKVHSGVPGQVKDTKLIYEDWLKLPLKEQKARAKEVQLES